MKPNKHQIYIVRRLWIWFWEKLMDGFAPSDKSGNYQRPDGFNFNYISKIDIRKNNNIFLLVGHSCPWCHRTIILHKLQHLSENISIIYLAPNFKNGQWIFKKPFYKKKTLNGIYKNIYSKNIFRNTLPVLLDAKNEKIRLLSNESAEITKFLNDQNEFVSNKSFSIKNNNNNLMDLINNHINNGVYMCGFARNQTSYKKASRKLFSALSKVDSILEKSGGPWINGKELSMADIYLFPTLIRWELVYSKLFKCTARELSEFKNLIKWRISFFNLPGISETCFEEKWVKDYYLAIFPLNPNQIIPIHKSLKEILRESTDF